MRDKRTGYKVRMQDGSTVEACCGPAILALGKDVKGYTKLPNVLKCQDAADPCPVKKLRAERERKREKALFDLRIRIQVVELNKQELEQELKRLKTELSNLEGRHIGDN
jgi:hypothetical protein